VADAVAIISVLSSAAVAISVPFINAWLERQRLRYQTSQERFAELRTLLDQSAERLTETQTVLVELLSQGLGKPTRREGAKQRLTELAIEVFQDNARLALRLGGDHRIYQAHSEAMSVLHKAEAEQRTGGIDIALTDLDAFGDGSGRSCKAL
jgi:acyl-CoA reductase-like NAD-dependent aldehyde dehydrogenase